jgi:Amt family ammonium transporter
MMRKTLSALMLAAVCGLAPAVWAQDGAAPAAIEAPAAEAVTEAAPVEAVAAEAAVVEEAAPTLDSGDTAWMMVSTVLVLFMTIPGLSLFYAGMVRAKNVLSIMMQCFAVTAMMSVLWMVFGYSLAFDTTGMEAGKLGLSSFVGGFDKAFLSGLTLDALTGTIPESVFITFQMTFAIITPALIVGAFAERMKFSSMMLFIALWGAVCYFPMVHMVWSGDGALMWDWGVLDFAGGTVVHINAGIAGLVACIVLGKRRGYGSVQMPPNNLVYTVVGASMLWVGWFGFNAGSAAAANSSAGMAMLVTQIATAAAALGWMFVEWITHKKPSALGIASGAVAGLVAITPAAGTVGPSGALIIGLLAGVICFFAATKLKKVLGYDDALDVFGVHAVGGIIGAVLTGIFAFPQFGGVWEPGEGVTVAGQLWIQVKSVLFTIVYTGVASYLLLKLVSLLTGGLRVSEEAESVGLDISEHNERGYILS